MAAAAIASAATLLLLLFLASQRTAAFVAPSALSRSLLSAGATPPIVLPLLRSSSNSSRRALARSLSAEEARMRLYDDLLHEGYYSTRVHIGTPPQSFALIVDTGSTVTYVPCSTCHRCGKHQDPRFQPESSATYSPLKCNGQCQCGANNQCLYDRKYAEMSTTSGVLGVDLVSFGSKSVLAPQRVIFGCENAETGDLYSQRADGIMGLGRGDLSIMDQLVQKGAIHDSFSLCYGGMDIGGGAMVLGEIPTPPGMVFSHSDSTRSIYYNLELKDIQVSGEPLHLDPRIFNRNHGTILDSGTTYAYLPEVAFIAVKDAIIKHMPFFKQIDGSDPNYNDFCFSGAGRRGETELSKDFPELDMVFGNGQKISLTPENYLFRHTKVPGAYCLGFFKNTRDSTTLLGGIIVRNTLVTYDRKNNRIGFLKTNCSELWEKFRDAPSSSPHPKSPEPSFYPNSTNSSGNGSEGSSTAPPNEFQYQFGKGEIWIESITFDVYLSINYADLVPRLPQLTTVLASELEIDASQIKILSSTSMGNGSLVRLAVYPATSEFFSNYSAMAIISRLEKHNVHLPLKYGTYQLRAWKVEQQKSMTWWEQHMLVLFLGGLAVAVLISSAFLIYYLHRRKQLLAYQPVDVPGPEPELQLIQQ